MDNLLRFLSHLYGFCVAFRLTLYRTGYRHSKKLNGFTISIGNTTAGGTGKTPLVEYLARLLDGEGYRVSILTRGYGRLRPWRQVVMNAGHSELPDVRFVGDEPLMLAKHLPNTTIVVNRDRFAAGKWAETNAGSEVHILDDGFQHLELDRDLNLLLIDAERPFDSGNLLPLGRLREPLTELRRADAVILTRTDRPYDQLLLDSRIRHLAESNDLPIFYAYHDLTALVGPDSGAECSPQSFQGRAVAMLCAIGRPELFSADLTHYGMQVVHSLSLPDHSRFDHNQLVRFFTDAQERGATGVVTTEKDWARLAGLRLPAEPALWIARLEARMHDHAGFRSFLLRSMQQRQP